MKPKHRLRLKADRHNLHRAYPEIFLKPGSRAPKRALKVNIHHDIMAHGGIKNASGVEINRYRVTEALKDYTAGRRYQEALARGGMRIDLDGKDVEPITPEAQQEAARRLAEMDRLRDDARALRAAAE